MRQLQLRDIKLLGTLAVLAGSDRDRYVLCLTETWRDARELFDEVVHLSDRFGLSDSSRRRRVNGELSITYSNHARVLFRPAIAECLRGTPLPNVIIYDVEMRILSPEFFRLMSTLTGPETVTLVLPERI